MRYLWSSKLLLVALLAVPFFAVPRRAVAQREERRQQDSDQPKPAAKKKPAVPQPRAIAVLEWSPEPPSPLPPTTSPAKTPQPVPAANVDAPSKDVPPKQARLVPISIFYDGAYQDAGVYLSQPTPLAVRAGNVYDLEKAGHPEGSFTVNSASRRNDSWLAYGVYKPVPPPKPFTPNVHIALGPTEDEEDSDHPVLKRRHPEDSSAPASSGKPAQPSSQGPVGSDDPDRPTLKRHDATAPASSGSQAPEGSDDPDRPVLHRAAGSSSGGSGDTVADLRSSDNYLNPADDPARPHIRRGVFQESVPTLPSLLGNPTNVRQTVGISDTAHADDHSFTHQWNNDAERDRAQQAMQQLALAQIAAWQKTMTPAPAPASQHSRSTAAHKSAAKPTALQFTAIQFAAFDLSNQDEPTYVFAAQTATTDLSQIFVAVVARPDIYGNLQVAFSSVTNGSQLQLTPRYRLVDAVDANGDGRAELLMEARNLDGRRFVLLDVYRGEAHQVFETGLMP